MYNWLLYGSAATYDATKKNPQREGAVDPIHRGDTIGAPIAEQAFLPFRCERFARYAPKTPTEGRTLHLHRRHIFQERAWKRPLTGGTRSIWTSCTVPC